MKKSYLASLLSILMVVFIPGYLFALPTSSLWIPGTESMGKSHLRTDFQQEYILNKASAGQNHFSSIGATLGFLDGKRWSAEFGFDYTEPLGSSLVDSILGSMKFSYTHEKLSKWKMAFGVRNFALSSVSNSQFLYAVGDFDLSQKDLTRIGVYSGSKKLLLSSKGEDSSAGIMFGYYRRFNSEFGRIAIEWVSGKNAFSYLMIGSHFRFSDSVNCVIGHAIPNDSDRKQKFIFRVSLFY